MSENLPDSVGVMILPGVTLFPGSLLPLYIFEPRYRRMVEAALAGDRMFAVAHAEEDSGVAAIAGLGVVRACVANADGTSNLILQGLSRVGVSGVKMKPFPKAQIERFGDEDPDPEVSSALRAEVQNAFGQLRKSGVEMPHGFEGYLAGIHSAGAYADAIAAAFVPDPVERRGFLEEPKVPVRLARLLHCLVRQLQGAG